MDDREERPRILFHKLFKGKIAFSNMKIVPTPDWFLGKDVIIEAFSFIVLFIFSFLSIRNYKLNKNRSFLYLGVGFALIALAQLAAVMTKLVLYYDIGPSQAIGTAIITSQLVSSVDIFYYAGFFFHRILTLSGLYIIYRLPRHKKSVGDYVLIIYFILISAFLSEGVFYLFHLTALVLLVLIVHNYYMIYKKNKFTNTKILMLAFGILALSQLFFIVSNLEIMFVLGNIIELVSYTILLILIIRILKYGKKKKSYGYNIRHAGNHPRKRW
jgi:hypothetical protein